jgi:hypothetical protein
MASETFAPSPTNCVLGKGKIYFDRFSSGTRTGFYEVGNAKDLKATPSQTRVTLPNYLTADGGTYAEALVSQEISVSCLVYEFNRRNIALLTNGTESTYTQSTQTVTGETLTAASANGQVWQTAYRNITPTAVINGTTTLTTATQWSTVDATSGLIKVLSTAGITEGQTLTVNYTAAAITGTNQKIVQLHNAGTIYGQFLYVSNNSAGADGELKYFYCSVQAGDLEGLIGDEFGSATLTWKALSDVAGTYGGSASSPYGTWYRR